MANRRHSTPAPDGGKSVRDLCRRWRYTEAQLKADGIILEEEEFSRRIGETEDELKAIEAQILDAEPRAADDAAEILHVVLDLIGENSTVDDRDTALLRQALSTLAWAVQEQKPEKPARSNPWHAEGVERLANLPELSEMSFAELAGVYDAVDVAGEVFLGFGGQPRLESTNGGKFVDTLSDTMGDLETAIADELERRQPVTDLDAQRKAEILSRYHLAGGDFTTAELALTNLRLFKPSEPQSREAKS